MKKCLSQDKKDPKSHKKKSARGNAKLKMQKKCSNLKHIKCIFLQTNYNYEIVKYLGYIK